VLMCICCAPAQDRDRVAVARAQGEGYLGPSYRPMAQDLTDSPLIQPIPEGAPPAYGLGGGGGNGGSAIAGVSLPRLDPSVRRSPLLTDAMPQNSYMDSPEPSSRATWSVRQRSRRAYPLRRSASGSVCLRTVS